MLRDVISVGSHRECVALFAALRAYFAPDLTFAMEERNELHVVCVAGACSEDQLRDVRIAATGAHLALQRPPMTAPIFDLLSFAWEQEANAICALLRSMWGSVDRCFGVRHDARTWTLYVALMEGETIDPAELLQLRYRAEGAKALLQAKGVRTC